LLMRRQVGGGMASAASKQAASGGAQGQVCGMRNLRLRVSAPVSGMLR
jgi:hypothetical protein